tara:strand:+ start:2371 stop:2562 length:192 start_codon:yes stop_codon:yes gene_type:complete
MNNTLKKDLIKEIKDFDKKLSKEDVEIVDNLLKQVHKIIKNKTLTNADNSLTENQLYLQYEIQ